MLQVVTEPLTSIEIDVLIRFVKKARSRKLLQLAFKKHALWDMYLKSG